MIPSRPQPRTGTPSPEDRTSAELQTGVFRSAPGTSMLSSTVGMVLAPHWSGRLRRFRRSEENGSLEVHDGTDPALEPFKETQEKSLTNGHRGQLRVPFSSTRQNMVGRTTEVDYETRRKTAQTASLDVNSAGIGQREAASRSPSSALNPKEQRTSPQTGPPGVPSLTLKPTSSSLLLSLRRSNGNARNATEAPSLSEKTRLSQRTLDCNGQATKHPDSLPTALRTVENGPVRSPTPSNPHQTTPFRAQLLSDSSATKGTAAPQPTPAKISADSSSRRVPYDHSSLPKAQPVPRRTTLTSTSWWKQVTQDSGPLSSSAAVGNSRPLAPASPGWADVSRCDRHTNETVNHESDLPFKQQHDSSLNSREPLKSHSLPGSSPGSKRSRAAEKTSVDVTKSYTNKGLLAASLTEVQASLKPTSSEPERYSNHLGANTPSHQRETPNPSSGLHLTPDAPSSFTANAVPPHNNLHAFAPTLRRTRTISLSPLGFERSYASIPFHPKPVSALIPTDGVYHKTNCSHVTAALSTSPPASGSRSAPTTVCGASPPSPAPPSALLTPPATPVTTSPSYADSSGPNEGRSLSSSQERDSRNPPAEGKKVRRVTWEDSVDVQQSQKLRADKAELPADSPPSRPSVSVRAPSIFGLLRPSHQTSPFCSQAPKISSILLGKEGKYRSLSSDSAELASRLRDTSEQTPSDCVVSNQGRQTPTTSRHERTLSLESGAAQLPRSGSLALPPELSSGYKLRYSSPPYTTLMSNRTAQRDAQAVSPRSVLHPAASQPSYRRLSPQAEPTSAPPAPKAVQSPVGPLQLLPLPFQTRASVVDLDDSLHYRNEYQGQVGPQRHHGSPSASRTQTLVCSTGAEADPAPKITPKPAGRPENAPLSAETQLSPPPEDQNPEEENSKRGSREALLGKSRYFSMESSQEQTQKKSRFALKRSTSSPNSSVSRSDSDRSSRANTKMDQMVNKLKKTFSTRRSEEDLSFPWKWRRTSQTPSVNGSADLSGVTVGSADSPKSAAMQEEDKELPIKGKEAEARDACAPFRCTLAPPAANGGSKGSACVEQMCVHQSHSPTSNQFLSCRDPSPGRGPASPAAYPTQTGKSTPSPRSPFSPFSSLSPVSSIPSPDVTDDVFYSPKPARRREPSSPCEPGEGFSLTASRRSRASTGPPSLSLSPENEYWASSCADLKYGIEPGRSFSVSSVLSCRPSRHGRISTGSRVMSVGSLCESALTYAGTHQDLDLDLECDGPLWAMGSTWGMRKGFQMYCSKDSTKVRSRSLPRSLTRCLSSWTSGVSPPSPGGALTARPVPLVDPDLGGSRFPWDAEGPPTPPPTPPPSPRCMSKPPSPSTPESPQQWDGLCRGHLPSRGHKSSLGTFDESSDSSSETTTDDEYYLETGEEEKETEL